LFQSLLNVALEWFISLQNNAETTVSTTLPPCGAPQQLGKRGT